MNDEKYYLDKVEFMNEGEGKLHLIDNVECELCRNKGIIYFADENQEIKVKDCECMKKRTVVRNIKKSGLKEQFQTYTFMNFRVTEEHHAHLKKQAFKYLKEPSSWWVVLGQVGVGKTHITVAILNELANNGEEFHYMRYATDMPRIQRGLVNFNVEVKEKAERDLSFLKKVPILYIDDYLKIRDTSNLFELIDYRYANNLKTLITSELDYKEQASIDEATASRIFEKANGYYITISRDENKNFRIVKGGK